MQPARPLTMINADSVLKMFNKDIALSKIKMIFSKRSRYSDWLWDGRPRGRNSSPGRVNNFHFSISSKPALGSTQPPTQWVPVALSPEVKRLGREADHSPLTGDVKKNVALYIHSPMSSWRSALTKHRENLTVLHQSHVTVSFLLPGFIATNCQLLR
jgi:hypothetical protein